ncbi:uncharacterized protein [Primulina eburnea]|uniref:uncharacterized protein n=1 Tax=Primulina eburnea TaxID=1245227 RepID=UPI003C6CAE69
MLQLDEEEVWRAFVDGASSLTECGVGVVIISPLGEKVKLALRIDVRVTNNEVEYETVLAGIRAAREVGASWIILYSDSQLITQQIKGVYEAKDDRMHKYLQLIKTQLEVFMDWGIEQIPWKENNEAYALTKMASSVLEASTREVLHVYRRSFQGPLLKCLSEGEVDYVLREIQEGCCDEHLRGISLAGKTMLAGFCLSVHLAPLINEVWTLWALSHRPQKKLLLVTVDYFSKWVETEPLAKITEQEVLIFLWKNIVCRFVVPRRLISDNGRQFQGREITSWCREMKITQSFTSVAYPQANGQTEVVNRIIVQALKIRLQGKGKDWVEELPSVLWAYRTTPRAPNQETPFNMVNGYQAVLPVEIGQTSSRVESYPGNNDQSRAMELDMVEEKRDRALIRIEAYRSRVIKSYNRKVRIRYFQVWDLVMKKVNPAGDVGKLEARWKGPYKITRKVSSGTFYLEDVQGHSLKRFRTEVFAKRLQKAEVFNKFIALETIILKVVKATAIAQAMERKTYFFDHMHAKKLAQFIAQPCTNFDSTSPTAFNDKAVYDQLDSDLLTLQMNIKD